MAKGNVNDKLDVLLQEISGVKTAVEGLDRKVDNVKGDVDQVKTVLKGYNGYKGLCQSHEELQSAFYEFKRKVYIVFAFMVGSGLLGAGIWGLVERVG